MPSVYPENGRTAWILRQRPPRRAAPGADTPHGAFLERERLATGEIVSSGVILLTNHECPWRCLMCDLWQDTLTAPTPIGAIPRQIEQALAALSAGRGLRTPPLQTQPPAPPLPAQLKLYNSGSFFDAAAIPPSDYAAIAGQVSFARHVVVESHPLLIGDRTLAFRDLLASGPAHERRQAGNHTARPTRGATLEIAVGLETANPEVLRGLNKGFTLEQFARAAEFLAHERIALRVFLLVGAPFVPGSAVDSAVQSAAFAFDCGASAVTLIPTRAGNGAMDRLREAGEWSPPSLRDLEAAHAGALALRRGRVFADTWGLERFSACPGCWDPRRERIERMNLTQTTESAVVCACVK